MIYIKKNQLNLLMYFLFFVVPDSRIELINLITKYRIIEKVIKMWPHKKIVKVLAKLSIPLVLVAAAGKLMFTKLMAFETLASHVAVFATAFWIDFG